MTEMATLKAEADKNFFHHLELNSYPGRGILVGLDETGRYLVQICWTMGRGEGSRNRVYKQAGNRVYTEVADPSKEQGDPALVIYNAMKGVMEKWVVSNGHQTDSVAICKSMAEGLHEWKYEPDPNSTSRITGVGWIGHPRPVLQLSLLRRSPFSDGCDRCHWEFPLPEAGFGYCLTTYMGDGNPLPPFRGEPLLMPLPGDVEKTTEIYWQALDPENRVSLAVRFIGIETQQSVTVITNKYEQVA